VAYSTVAAVKLVLQIAVDELKYDAEIDAYIVSGDEIIVGLLKKSELSVPDIVPKLIADASAYFAAWLFRHRRDPDAAEVFWVEAHKFLDTYVESEEEVAFKVGSSA